jgi:hypothetical protein
MHASTHGCEMAVKWLGMFTAQIFLFTFSRISDVIQISKYN